MMVVLTAKQADRERRLGRSGVDDFELMSEVLCIHYGALDYVKRRGGGLLVYVEEQTAQVQKVVQTQ
jgi:hypothetical protein